MMKTNQQLSSLSNVTTTIEVNQHGVIRVGDMIPTSKNTIQFIGTLTDIYSQVDNYYLIHFNSGISYDELIHAIGQTHSRIGKYTYVAMSEVSYNMIDKVRYYPLVWAIGEGFKGDYHRINLSTDIQVSSENGNGSVL